MNEVGSEITPYLEMCWRSALGLDPPEVVLEPDEPRLLVIEHLDELLEVVLDHELVEGRTLVSGSLAHEAQGLEQTERGGNAAEQHAVRRNVLHSTSSVENFVGKRVSVTREARQPPVRRVALLDASPGSPPRSWTRPRRGGPRPSSPSPDEPWPWSASRRP